MINIIWFYTEQNIPQLIQGKDYFLANKTDLTKFLMCLRIFLFPLELNRFEIQQTVMSYHLHFLKVKLF